MTTILLADDHSVLRSGLKLLLESQPDFRVLGEASSGLEAIELAGNCSPICFCSTFRCPAWAGWMRCRC